MLLSDAAERARADALTVRLTKNGALVTRLDADAFRSLLDQTTSGCVFPAGDLDNLARFVQAYAKLPGYQPAILLGLGASGDVATLPEMQRLGKDPMVYVCGQNDGDGICPQLDTSAFHTVSLPGDHHFDDAYDKLLEIILGTLGGK